MASIRPRQRKDGSYTYAVLFNLDARQTSVPFTDEADAEKFKILVNAVGGRRAMDAYGIADIPKVKSVASGPTVAEFLDGHIKGLSGVERKTITEYTRYLTNDIGPAFGSIPLTNLTREDVALWGQCDAGCRRGRRDHSEQIGIPQRRSQQSRNGWQAHRKPMCGCSATED